MSFSLTSWPPSISLFFFFNNPPPTEFSPLPLHAALPFWPGRALRPCGAGRPRRPLWSLETLRALRTLWPCGSSGRQRIQSIRRRGERLTGIQWYETARAAAHSNLQPMSGACKNARAEIECDSEQSIAHAGRRIRDWPGESRAVGGRIVNRKSQIVNAIGWIATVGQSALASEGRSQRGGQELDCGERQSEQHQGGQL